ncbi:MAG: carbamoyltransferase [Alphaproteobacteria bacterium]|nr:carbamoyltransferase [Alphaproteobacteria bacterium]
MNILGIVTKSHDTGAAVLQNGRPLIVLEEERFNREKHTKAFPEHAIDEIFGRQGFDIQDFDALTTPWNMKLLRRSVLKAVTGNLPASLNLLRPAAHKTQDTATVNIPMRIWLQLGKRVGYKNLPKLHQVAHHDAHASIYFLSPFEDATVLVMDGYGDETATSVYLGQGNHLEQLWTKDFFDSLGMLYTCISEHLGFPVFQEGTVMALAACGGPTYVDDVRKLVTLLPDGQFAINREHMKYNTHGFLDPFHASFHKMFGAPRLPGETITDQHRDLAFALQKVTEDTILHVVRELSRRHPSRNLVLSGGVALNCVANARIVEETDYENVWVPPVASDSGVVLGSTLWHWHQTLNKPREQVLTHAYYGAQYDDHEIVTALERAGLTFERFDDATLLSRTAQDLSEQKIVGWFQGAAEIGPRALGNRSILSDARSNTMKDLINARIKHREAFRPFAPVILVERLEEYFDFNTADPFMTMAPRIRPEKLDAIPAAAHVDGTGRIQTIQRDANPRYYDLIAAYEKITGIPVILNTSFNRQEPVVNNPDHAISCFLRTDMDVLVLGNYYSTDRNPEAIANAHATFTDAGGT